MSAKSRWYIFAASAGSAGVRSFRAGPTAPSYHTPIGNISSALRDVDAGISRNASTTNVRNRFMVSILSIVPRHGIQRIDHLDHPRIIAGEIRFAKLGLE